MTSERMREWRDGWPMVLAAAMGVGLVAAPVYAIGVFMAPLEHAFGWSRTALASTISLMSAIVAFGSPLVGVLLDRWGARRIALTGTLLSCSVVAAMSRLGGAEMWLWVMWGLFGGAALFCSPLVWQMAVVNRFSTDRGLALSLALCGSNLFGAVAPLLCEILLDRFGWRDAYLGLAAFLFLATFPLAYVFFYDARDLAHAQNRGAPTALVMVPLSQGATLAEALASRNFWLLATGFTLAGACITGMVVHLFPILTSIGIGTLQAAGAVSAMSVAAIAARLAVGAVMDRVFAPYLSAFVLFLPVAGCLALIYVAPSNLLAICAASLVGFSIGAEFNMVSFLTSRYFGMRRFGAIHGLLYGAFVFGSIFSPFLLGMLYVSLHDYTLALKLMAGAFAIAASSMLFCTAYPDFDAARDKDGADMLGAEAMPNGC